MVNRLSMNFSWALMIALGFGAATTMAQSQPSDAKNRQGADSKKAAKAPAKESKPRKNIEHPVTVTQVERATGGQVIGARKILVQGRRLNQIKLKMPDGRIIIYSQLFDEFGRSVDTVETIEPADEPETRSAKQ
jgi:hypothetical protein